MTKLSRFADKISPDEIIVGKIGAARGIDGLVKIVPLTDFEGRFDGLKEIKVGGKIMSIESIKHISGGIFAKFAGVENREDAKLLTNKFLTVPKSKAAPLAEGEFYTFDIIGCEVFDGEKFFGKVTNVLKTGSNDVFQVEGEKEILIPALKKVVTKIDIPNKKIFIDSAALEEI